MRLSTEVGSHLEFTKNFLFIYLFSFNIPKINLESKCTLSIFRVTLWIHHSLVSCLVAVCCSESVLSSSSSCLTLALEENEGRKRCRGQEQVEKEEEGSDWGGGKGPTLQEFCWVGVSAQSKRPPSMSTQSRIESFRNTNPAFRPERTLPAGNKKKKQQTN